MNESTFGERLESLLKERNMTRKQLASDAGISVAAIGNYIKGHRQPNYAAIAGIAKALDVSADYLRGFTTTKSINEDIQIARETTGLSEGAIVQLQEWCKEWPEYIEIISKLLESPWFDDFLWHIKEYRLLACGKFALEDEKIREIVQQDQARAMEYLGAKECSTIVRAFVALKSNLDARDISEFHLQAAQKKIGYTIEHLNDVKQET